MNQLAYALQLLAQREAWTGTASQLAAVLNAVGFRPSITAARLSIQLHNLEPELWWRYGALDPLFPKQRTASDLFGKKTCSLMTARFGLLASRR